MDELPPANRPEFIAHLEAFQAQLNDFRHSLNQLPETTEQQRLSRSLIDLQHELKQFIPPQSSAPPTDPLSYNPDKHWQALSACLPVGIFTCDRQGRCTYINPRCEEIIECRLEDAIGEGWIDLVHPDDRSRVVSKWLAHAKAGHPYTEEFRAQLPTGKLRWVHARSAPVFTHQGELIGHTGTIEDITKQKLAEAKIKASLHEKEALLKEIHHRVKNNLQIISSLIYLQSQRIEDQAVRQVFEDSQSRISSMALVHDTLYRSRNFAQVNLSEYVQTLTASLFQTYRMQPDDVKLSVRVEAGVVVSLDQAIPCGLILNELMTNALKHGFKDGKVGKVTVILEQQLIASSFEQAMQVCLIVENDGHNLPESFELQKIQSMGLRLVNALVNQLHGQVEVEKSTKARFKVTFKHA